MYPCPKQKAGWKWKWMGNTNELEIPDRTKDYMHNYLGYKFVDRETGNTVKEVHNQ
jgi:hypothetical protein